MFLWISLIGVPISFSSNDFIFRYLNRFLYTAVRKNYYFFSIIKVEYAQLDIWALDTQSLDTITHRFGIRPIQRKIIS